MDPSADSSSPSPSTSFNNRDWFFPSQSFIHSSQFPRAPARRFSSPYPKRSVTTPFHHQQTSPSQNSSFTDHHHQHYYPKYAGVRRRSANLRNEKSTTPNVSVAGGSAGLGIKRMSDDAVSEHSNGKKAPPVVKKFAGFLGGRLTIPWHTVFSVAVS